jgi:hypothetical protein
MAFLSGKNIAFLIRELKQFYGEGHYDFIDDNTAYEAQQWFRRQPTTRDIQRLGGLYALNEDFISYYTVLLNRSGPVDRTIGYPEEESCYSAPRDFGHKVFGNEEVAENPVYRVVGEPRRPISRSMGQQDSVTNTSLNASIKLRSTNDIFDEITLGGMKVGDYLNDREKTMMKHDIFRGRTKGRGHLKIDRPVATSEPYYGCHCQDCGQAECNGCDTDVYYSRANRRKLQIGARNQTTGSTLSELSSVRDYQPITPSRYPQFGYAEDVMRQPTKYRDPSQPQNRYGMNTDSVWLQRRPQYGFNGDGPMKRQPTGYNSPNHITGATLSSRITGMVSDYPIDHKSDPGHIGLYALQPPTRMHSLDVYKKDMLARQFPSMSRNTAERQVAIDNRNQHNPDRDFNYEYSLYARKLSTMIDK